MLYAVETIDRKIGYSNYICGKKKLFSELDKSIEGEVKFGNNNTLPMFVIGKILIAVKDGYNNFISRVFLSSQVASYCVDNGKPSGKFCITSILGKIYVLYFMKRMV